jgi:superfamily II DNA or RNA helicase
MGLAEIGASYDRGVQRVLEIETSRGRKITVTLDHEMVTPDGKVPAAKLAVGDALLIDPYGIERPKVRKAIRRVGHRNSKHIQEPHRYVDKDGYVRLRGIEHDRASTGGVYEHVVIAEALLGRALRADEEVHHINQDRADNRPTNLEVLHRSDHRRQHDHVVNFGFFSPATDLVTAIRDAGEDHVYDFHILDDAHTFVGNGIIVGNTGKTLVSLALLDRWGVKRVIVACPKSVISTWPREVRTHLETADEWIVLADQSGSIEQRAQRAEHMARVSAMQNKRFMLVVNHEAVWRKPMAELVQRTAWGALIVDESHRAKSPGGKLSVFLSRTSRSAAHVLALSGTPLPHSKLDIYAQARFIDNGRTFGTSFAGFKARYAVMGGFQRHQVIGWQNSDEYERKLASMAWRIRKEEALSLPEEVDATRSCMLSERASKVYLRMAQDMAVEIREGTLTAANALVKLLRLQQITSGSIPTDDGREIQIDTAKADLLEDVLEDLDEPVVVFVRFRSDLDAVARIAEKLGLAYGEVSGRRKDLDEGRYPKDVRVLGVQIQAGGVGIDLTRARVAIYYSMGFSLGDYLQARARVHRPGQSRAVMHLHLVAEGTIDEVVIAALQKRRDAVEAVLESLR